MSLLYMTYQLFKTVDGLCKTLEGSRPRDVKRVKNETRYNLRQRRARTIEETSADQ